LIVHDLFFFWDGSDLSTRSLGAVLMLWMVHALEDGSKFELKEEEFTSLFWFSRHRCN
jgi:hypothetical protein